MYCNGAAPYAGNASRCYAKVFVGVYDEDDLDSPIKARELLMKPEIQSYLETLEKQAYTNNNYIKRYLDAPMPKMPAWVLVPWSMVTAVSSKNRVVEREKTVSLAVPASRWMGRVMHESELQVIDRVGCQVHDRF